MFDIIRKIGEFIEKTSWSSVYFSLREFVIFLDVLLAAAFVWVFILALKYRPKFVSSFEKYQKKKFEKDPDLLKKWQKILLEAGKNPPQSFVLAIIEADKFIDEVLKRMGLPGEHMADRLERLNAYDLKTLDKLWRAHRIRNELVHSPDFNISAVDAREILEIYERFLKELGVL